VTAVVSAVCALFGLVIGSFLNVVIWRVPRRESIVTPPSHCPGCDAPIAPYDNVPVVSWLLLRGRCRHCGEHISARYPLIELLTAGLFAAMGVRFHDSWALPAYLFMTAALVAISFIDLDHKIIPVRVVYPTGVIGGALLALASWLEDDWDALLRAALAAVAAFAFFWIVNFIVPRGLGYGDVRLSFLLGMFLGWLGWPEVFTGLFFGFMYGAVIGVLLIVLGVTSRRQQVPFGPYLALGAITIVLVGGPIIDWYRSLSG
jgi:leader peptidase (prepilin peptidase)/N-methyltransferase